MSVTMTNTCDHTPLSISIYDIASCLELFDYFLRNTKKSAVLCVLLNESASYSLNAFHMVWNAYFRLTGAKDKNTQSKRQKHPH